MTCKGMEMGGWSKTAVKGGQAGWGGTEERDWL